METMKYLLLFTGVKRSRKNLRAHLINVCWNRLLWSCYSH